MDQYKDLHTVGQLVEYFIDKYSLHDWKPGITTKFVIITMLEKAIVQLLKLKK